MSAQDPAPSHGRAVKKWAFCLALLVAIALVLANGAWVVWRRYYSAEQLLAAVKAKDFERARMLLALGARCDAVDGDGFTALHLALVYRGPDYVINQMLSAGSDVKATGNEGQTPLHFAVAMDRMEAARSLLDAGADINRRTSLGFTPISLAILGSHSEMMSLLIERGAEINEDTVPYSFRVPSSSVRSNILETLCTLRVLLDAARTRRAAGKVASGEFIDIVESVDLHALQARTRRIRNSMATDVSFEFDQTPVQDALALLARQSGVDIILDDEYKDARWITLKLTDESMEHALGRILRLVDLHYTERNGAIFVSDYDGVIAEFRKRADSAPAAKAAPAP